MGKLIETVKEHCVQLLKLIRNAVKNQNNEASKHSPSLLRNQ